MKNLEIKNTGNKIPRQKQSKFDNFSKAIIASTTLIVLAMLLLLFIFIIYKAIPIFHDVGFKNFFSGNWNPNEDKNIASYGILKIVFSTIILLIYTLLICVPITIFASLFISEYLKGGIKKRVIAIVQLLAGIPSVVFGLFAFDQIGGLTVLMGAKTNGNLTTASVTLAFMALPTMISLSINAIESVPKGYRWGSLAIGVTKERTTIRIVFKAALKGIISAIIIGIARIVGETMAIILIAGNSTNGVIFNEGFSSFIFSSIRTLAGTIGLEMLENSGKDHESALYAIGLILFVLVIIINLIVLFISRDKVNKIKSKNAVKGKNLVNDDYKNIYIFSKKDLNEIVNKNSEKFFWKRIESIIIGFCLMISTAVIISFVFWILATLIIRGVQGWTWQNFVSINGQKSGIFSTIGTTLILVFLTITISVPLSLIVAIYLAEYANQKSSFVKFIRFSISILSSTPSIVFGVFGLTIFIQTLGMRMSILTGALTMVFVISPPLIINFETSILSIDESHKIAAYGMGLRKISVIIKILIPCAMNGIFTGIILSIARIIGEAAPVYLTLGTVVRAPINGFLSPGATMTTIIYMLSSEGATSTSTSDTYQIALVLVIIILFINNFGLYLSKKFDYLEKKQCSSFKQKVLNYFVVFNNPKLKFQKIINFFVISYKKIISKIKSLSYKSIRMKISDVKERNKSLKIIYDKVKRKKSNAKK